MKQEYIHIFTENNATKGKSILGFISGRKCKRVGIVAVKLGKEIIKPLKDSGTMSSELFKLWFEKKILPSLSKDTVIVMDNMFFHRKKHLLCTAQKYGYSLIFLTHYSPELNSTEKFWTWLKR